MCQGEYCKKDCIHNLNELPEYHFNLIIKQHEGEEQFNYIPKQDRAGKKDDDILPDLDNFNYQIPKMLLILDQDIKNMWREDCLIKQKIDDLMKNNKQSMKRSQIVDVYSMFLNSTSGQKYINSKVIERTAQVKVCYSCYQFYTEFYRAIFSKCGFIIHDQV